MAVSPQDVVKSSAPFSPSEIRGADRIEEIIDDALQHPNLAHDCIERNGEYTVYLPLTVTTRLVQEVTRRYLAAGWKNVTYGHSEQSQWFKLFAQ